MTNDLNVSILLRCINTVIVAANICLDKCAIHLHSFEWAIFFHLRLYLMVCDIVATQPTINLIPKKSIKNREIGEKRM